jgi:tetratricopeptide (TPR) repeat protein
MSRTLCVVGMTVAMTASSSWAEERGTQQVPAAPQLPERVLTRYPKGDFSAGGESGGLVLSAGTTDPAPSQSECVTLWLKLTNVSGADLYVYQHMWDVEVYSAGSRTSVGIVCAFAKNHSPIDFIRLKAGESIDYLMDADVPRGALGAGDVRAHLTIGTPGGAKKQVEHLPGSVYPGNSQIVSGSFALHYAAALPGRDAGDKLVASYLKREPNAEDVLVHEKNVAPALRRALKKPRSIDRWSVFQFICRHPDEVFTEDVVDFVARWGPRLRDGKLLEATSGSDDIPFLRKARLHEMLRSFGKVLPKERRLAFFNDVARAAPYDWREMGTLVSDFTIGSDAAQLACAAKVFLVHIARGRMDGDVLNFAAWQLFTSLDVTLRDRERAEEISQLAVKVEPGNMSYAFALANIRGDKAAIKKLVNQSKDPSALNSMAWSLATAGNPTPAQGRLAVALSKRALELVGNGRLYAYILDTLGASHCAAGEFDEALEVQEKGFRLIPEATGLRPEYATRLVQYIAFAANAAAPPGGINAGLDTFSGTRSRDALIARLAITEDELLRKTILRALRASFGDDPTARRIIDDPPVPQPERPAEKEDGDEKDDGSPVF